MELSMPAEPAGLPEVKDSRDYALVVLVNHQGVADANANGVSYEQAAEWLRAIADTLEQRHVPGAEVTEGDRDG